MAEPVRVPLRGGLFALVDATDAERVLARKWRERRHKHAPTKVYAQCSYREDGFKRNASLHRFVMGCTAGDGRIVDHINGDGLDNRRANLRITDHRGNATNVTRSKLQKRGGYKGVSWNPRAKKWQASICGGEVKANGKRRQLYLGVFTDPADAARAYDAAAIKLFGEFGCLNFPDGWFGPAEPPTVAATFAHLQADLGGVDTADGGAR
jgi:hypothetical protein